MSADTRPQPLRPLTFAEMQMLCALRSKEGFKTPHWSIETWALALAGETGELCNLVKKVGRGDFSLESQKPAMLKELADVITYALLAIDKLGGDAGREVWDKFQEVNERIGWTVAGGLRESRDLLSISTAHPEVSALSSQDQPTTKATK